MNTFETSYKETVKLYAPIVCEKYEEIVKNRLTNTNDMRVELLSMRDSLIADFEVKVAEYNTYLDAYERNLKIWKNRKKYFKNLFKQPMSCQTVTRIANELENYRNGYINIKDAHCNIAKYQGIKVALRECILNAILECANLITEYCLNSNDKAIQKECASKFNKVKTYPVDDTSDDWFNSLAEGDAPKTKTAEEKLEELVKTVSALQEENKVLKAQIRKSFAMYRNSKKCK